MLSKVYQMIAELDRDVSGAIDFEEFLDANTSKLGDKETREGKLGVSFGVMRMSKSMIDVMAVNSIEKVLGLKTKSERIRSLTV